MWWTLLGATVAGSASVLVIHFFIHYTAFIHLLPVYFGSAALAVALILGCTYLMYRAD